MRTVSIEFCSVDQVPLAISQEGTAKTETVIPRRGSSRANWTEISGATVSF
jgi:hypothetical protein